MKHSPEAIFVIGVLVVTGLAAWILKTIVEIGRAVRLPKEKP